MSDRTRGEAGLAAGGLEAWGWDSGFAAAFAGACEGRDPGRLLPGRVVAQRRGVLDLLTAEGLWAGRPAGALGHPSMDPLARPAVGDWVVVERPARKNDTALVRFVLPRRSAFVRKTAGAESRPQLVAANVDRALLVVALGEPFNERRFERFLVFARESGAAPWVVLAKVDLATEEERELAVAAVERENVPCILLSARSGAGVEELRATLVPRQTHALLGPSGVGKSTLANALLGEERLRTGSVDASGRGRHTTTRREIVIVPGGALLLDTPGLRELQPWDVEEGLSSSFADIEALAGQCRFGDCRHQGEPGCAVAAAVERGGLEAARLDHFRKLSAENAAAESRRDDRLRHESKRHDRTLAKALRSRLDDKYGRR